MAGFAPQVGVGQEPIAVAKTEVIAELARAYGTAPPLLGLFSAKGTTLPDFIHPPTDVEIRFSTPAMPQGRWVEQAWRCVFALEMPETLLLMLHPSAPPLNEGCWDDLLSTLALPTGCLRRLGLEWPQCGSPTP